MWRHEAFLETLFNPGYEEHERVKAGTAFSTRFSPVAEANKLLHKRLEAGMTVRGGTITAEYFTTEFREGVRLVATIEKWINVDVPVKIAYDQWTQFESFPQFMEGVEEVRQIGNMDLQWRVNIGGKIKEFETEITEQIPEKRIAWKTRGGTENAGVVTFHRIGDADHAADGI